MKVLILEGVATSGKSTIIDKLQEALPHVAVKVYGEPDTHIPIMDKPHGLHIDFFEELIQKALASKADLVIFDRLYLTQAYRASVSIAAYASLEEILPQHSTLTAFLRVDEETLSKRVQLATEHREKTWGEYVKTKGDTFEEIARYYVAQQRSQLALLPKSKIASKTFNTTQHNYDEIVKEIILTLGL